MAKINVPVEHPTAVFKMRFLSVMKDLQICWIDLQSIRLFDLCWQKLSLGNLEQHDWALQLWMEWHSWAPEIGSKSRGNGSPWYWFSNTSPLHPSRVEQEITVTRDCLWPDTGDIHTARKGPSSKLSFSSQFCQKCQISNEIPFKSCFFTNRPDSFSFGKPFILF